MADMQQPDASSISEFDVVVVGAGVAGLYMLHRLRGMGFSVRVYEAGEDVGGTWYWNRYPGARCDIESVDYSYSFSDELQQEWSWSYRYAAQPEILAYLNHVADRFDLRRDIQFNTRVAAAHYDEPADRWLLTMESGERVAGRFCVMATGCLSTAQLPRIPGLESFRGTWYHTGHWPHDGVDFTGQRVGVIGTGSSAIQAIPVIAEQAAHLYVFQRTPNFSVPAWNRPTDPEEERAYKATYAERRRKARESRSGFLIPLNRNSETPAFEVSPEEREKEFRARWERGGFGLLASFSDLYSNKADNDLAAQFVHARIREIVHDPEVAEALLPRDHPIGTKRLCVDTNYYETYNRENVTLVNIRTAPIEAISETGIRTTEAEYELDSIVFATGFDAMTGALFAIDIRGRGGQVLKEKWAAGPRTYLGLMSAGFPNLFLITSIEQHVEWVSECIDYLHERNIATIEPTLAAEDDWVEHVNEVAAETLYPTAASWYMGANVPGKPRIFMPYVGGVGAYRKRCEEIAQQGYEGFTLGERVVAGSATTVSGRVPGLS
jgi:cyclohexanone monooxygenase